MALTAFGAMSATLIFCLAASVVFIGAQNGPYRFDVLNQPGLRPGVIITMLLLSVPTLIFVGQCSRFGAPARDRRLARLRMAGARPSEVATIVGQETGIAALLGSGFATTTFLIAKRLISTEHIATITTETPMGNNGILLEKVTTTVRYIPTDVTFPLWAVIALVLAVPILATIFSSVALRKIIISPFGVSRTVPTAPPRVLPALLFGGGTAALMGWSTVARLLDLQQRAFPLVALVAFVFFVMVATGLIIGGGSIASVAGQFVSTRTNRPALLIAGRRLIAAPYTSSRATTSILLAVFIGGAIQGIREAFLVGTDPDDTFYATTFDLLNFVLIAAVALSCASLIITTTEAVVERRRTLAALNAAGTPRSTLATSLLAETLIPLVPSVLLAACAGILSARGVTGTHVEAWNDRVGGLELIPVPTPIVPTAALALAAITLGVVATAVSLIGLRRSLEISELRTAA